MCKDTHFHGGSATNSRPDTLKSRENPESRPRSLGFPELRIIAQAAYDLIIGAPDALSAHDRSGKVGELFYPQTLPNDQRRLGSMLSIIIRSLDEHLRREQLLDGPALHEDTRRLIVADVIASAHLQSKDLGYLQKKIDEWYPKGEFVEEGFSDEVLKSAVPATEAGTAAFLGKGRKTDERRFKLEDALGGAAGEEFRQAYGTLEAVIHGAAFTIESAISPNEWDGAKGFHPVAHALRDAFYTFNNNLRPMLKGEVVMKGEG